MTDHNHCLFAGRASQAPKAFGKVVKITVATNHAHKNDKGEWLENTRYVPITILRDKLAAWVLANVKVGDSVVATCMASNDSYKNAAGETVYETQLVATAFNGYGASKKSDQHHED